MMITIDKCKKFELVGYVEKPSKEGELEASPIKCFANRAKAIKYLNEYLVYDSQRNLVIDPGTKIEYVKVILFESLFSSDNNNQQ